MVPRGILGDARGRTAGLPEPTRNGPVPRALTGRSDLLDPEATTPRRMETGGASALVHASRTLLAEEHRVYRFPPIKVACPLLKDEADT